MGVLLQRLRSMRVLQPMRAVTVMDTARCMAMLSSRSSNSSPYCIGAGSFGADSGFVGTSESEASRRVFLVKA